MTVSRALRSKSDIEIAPAAPELAYVASDHPREQAPARRLLRKEIADSIQETYLVCFEDGMRYRMLRRQLRLYGLTPHAYRV